MMSGGSPTAGGGYMRQRQGYFSSGDDLEDDACSRIFTESTSFPTTRTWVEVVENFLWITSALFIIYYGDRHYNFIYILWHDNRIRRIPLYVGMFAVGLNILFFLYTSTLAWGIRKSTEKWEVPSIAALPFVTVNGLISFCLFVYALWPIWSFLTLPLVVCPIFDALKLNMNGLKFTLFMACMVIFPYLVLGTCKPQADMLRTD